MDGHSLAYLRIPFETLMALDSRTLHFHMQPFHHLIRLAHIVSMAAFFGAIGLLDLRLLGFRSAVPLRAFAENVLPWLYATFGVAFATGVALFLYDPVHVGSHAYFTPKLILIALGVMNALLYHLYALSQGARRRGRHAGQRAGGRWHFPVSLDRRAGLRLPQHRGCPEGLSAVVAGPTRDGTPTPAMGDRASLAVVNASVQPAMAVLELLA